MTALDRPERLVAAAVAILAGFVDAVGFIELGGLFVSFMSGNSTRMAVGIAQGAGEAIQAAMLIGCFVAGVMCGAFISALATARRRPALLALVALLLALGAASGAFGQATVATLLMAGAMGAVNSVLDHTGEVRVALTYMTGTLVKLGQKLAHSLMGRKSAAWLPYLFQWLALVAGAVTGGLAYARLGFSALWIAAALAAALSVITMHKSLRGS